MSTPGIAEVVLNPFSPEYLLEKPSPVASYAI